MADRDRDDDDYEVGYGKPPKHSRFPPGQSGNPKGRRKGSRGLKSDLEAELNAVHTITNSKDGSKMKDRQQRLAIKTLCRRAALGDLKAQGILFPLILQIFGVEDRGEGRAQAVSAGSGDPGRLARRAGRGMRSPPSPPKIAPPQTTTTNARPKEATTMAKQIHDPQALFAALMRHDFGAFLRKAFPWISRRRTAGLELALRCHRARAGPGRQRRGPAPAGLRCRRAMASPKRSPAPGLPGCWVRTRSSISCA